MKIVIAGGSGQVGTILSRVVHGDGHEVTVLSRRPAPAPWRTFGWDGRALGPWVRELDGADVIINLAGRSVNCRYTAANRREITESRVNATRTIGRAIPAVSRPPRVWLQASTATLYTHRYDQPNDEITGRLGGSEENAPDTLRFSIDVARAWEQAANEAEVPHTRKVLLRSAMVMSPDRGGVFDVLLRLVRLGLSGRSGDGRQFVSWIHDQDFVRAIYWLIEHDDVSGAVNLAAPHPLPNAEFMRALRSAWGTRVGLPSPTWMLEIGAFVLRTETELILKSRRVVPGRLQEAGFEFRFPEWPNAAHDLCQRWRERRSLGSGRQTQEPESSRTAKIGR